MKNTDDKNVDRPKVDTWKKLRDALRYKFFPNNSSWVSRDRLKWLKHIGSIWDYVKNFTSLLLDIQSMSDEYKLHNFIFGIQGQAQNEIHRQKIKDLPNAITVVDTLVDFCSTSLTSDPTLSSKSKKKEKSTDLKKDKQKRDENDKGKGKMDTSS